MTDDNGEQILQELLENSDDDDNPFGEIINNLVNTAAPSEDEPKKEAKADKETHCQWALAGNGKFTPVGSTAPKLPAGIYEPFSVPGMWGLERLDISSDGIYSLPDMATEVVLEEVDRFWANEAKYRQHSLLYKRGIILWGPPGGGKTVTVKILMNRLVKKDGIVIIVQNVHLAILCLKAIRKIEPNRNLIVVLEDIDEILRQNGESVVLSMLDGENNVDNILHLATTNYPDRLGARIINRPSRFDRRVYVGMPGPDARKVYLEKATNNGLDDLSMAKWIEDTKDMSIAHLRELVAAVYCLEQPYDDVLLRLKAMATQVKVEDEFKRKGMGFKTPMPTRNPYAGAATEGIKL